MDIGFVIGNKLCLDMQTIRERAACNAGAPASIPRSGRSEKEMTTCCGILAWEIPRIEEPGGLQSIGSQRDKLTFNPGCVAACLSLVSDSLQPHGL